MRTHERIELTDSLPHIIAKMSDGNPGAISVLVSIAKGEPTIDPDNAFGGLGGILFLDTLGIYGSRIWLLYKDVCGESLNKMLAVLRSVQLGHTRCEEINGAIGGAVMLDLDGIVKRVKEALPRFITEAPTTDGHAEG